VVRWVFAWFVLCLGGRGREREVEVGHVMGKGYGNGVRGF
jgi:hypothetical protein